MILQYTIYFLVGSSVTRWLDYFWLLGHLYKCKVAQKDKNLPKMAQNIAKYLFKLLEIAQDLQKILLNWRKFAKSGHTGG